MIDFIDPRIDLTAPIYEQVLRLAELDKAEEIKPEHTSDAA